MGTIPNNNTGGQQRGDGQKNYQHSNERNPDHNRSDTQKHEYKHYDDALTNDVNFEEGKPIPEGINFDDKNENAEKQ